MIVVKTADTEPLILDPLRDNGVARNLDGCEVEFRMRQREGAKLVTVEATIEDAARGIVAVPWDTGDLDTPGLYDAEVEVTDTDNDIRVYPREGYWTVDVQRALG